jgi:hypothetical protein
MHKDVRGLGMTHFAPDRKIYLSFLCAQNIFDLLLQLLALDHILLGAELLPHMLGYLGRAYSYLFQLILRCDPHPITKIIRSDIQCSFQFILGHL